jgi:hypothetical protein
MPVNITPPIDKEFILEKSDKEFGNSGDPTIIKVIQAREGGRIARQQLWEKFERTYEAAGDITVAQEVNPAIVRRLEVFLTLAACNITTGEKQEPLFKFPLKEAEFNQAWATLPPIVADEIHEKVMEMNPPWNYGGE